MVATADAIRRQVRGGAPGVEGKTGATAAGTPLSDLITDLCKSRSRESYARFLEAFFSATVGVRASGAPKGTLADCAVTREHPVLISSSVDAHGRRVVLVYADPPAFRRNFGSRFNAEMTGEGALQTALASPECAGVRVNSATEEVSVVIDRETVERVLGSTKARSNDDRRPWWKFW